MKNFLSLSLLIAFQVSAPAQDIFIFKNGTIRTCYKIVQEFKTSLQVETTEGEQTYITLDKLSFVQSKDHQFIYDQAKHPTLTLIDLQEPHQEQCFVPGPQYIKRIDNQTPGTKATIRVEKSTFYRNRCLSQITPIYMSKGDEVTLEKADGIERDPPFAGSYLVNCKSADGQVTKGWIKKSDVTLGRQ